MKLAQLVRLAKLAQRAHREFRVRLARPAPRDRPAKTVKLAQLVRLEKLAQLARRGFKAILARPARQVAQLARQVPLVRPARQGLRKPRFCLLGQRRSLNWSLRQRQVNKGLRWNLMK